MAEGIETEIGNPENKPKYVFAADKITPLMKKINFFLLFQKNLSRQLR